MKHFFIKKTYLISSFFILLCALSLSETKTFIQKQNIFAPKTYVNHSPASANLENTNLRHKSKFLETFEKNSIILNSIILRFVITKKIAQSCENHELLVNSWHFDSKILRDPRQTKDKLITDGFKLVNFKNKNNIMLSGLLLERSNAKATIIFSHGFCPGGKEAFAPFVKIAPNYCNLLFIDMTGYGDSQGSNIIFRIGSYGQNDYLDILSAIEFINNNEKTKNLPIILFGWCSGAFHSANALINLESQCAQKKLKGLIFDSGFASLTEISDVPKKHITENYLPGLFAKFYNGDKKLASNSYICSFANILIWPLLKTLELIFTSKIKSNADKTSLYNRIEVKLKTPILIIHNPNDSYSKWENVKKMTENVQNKEIWLTEEQIHENNTGTNSFKISANHANNHLKFKKEYKQKLKAWLDKIIS